MEAYLIAGILVVLVGVVLYRQRRDESPKRKLRYNASGQLVAIEEVIRQQPFRLQGRGTFSTEPVQLEQSTYKVEYQFPEKVLVKVDLLSMRDGEREMILLKRGAGAESFAIGMTGRYVFDIAPVDEEASWVMEISRLGLPSREIGESV